jgi:hypothetical protein
VVYGVEVDQEGGGLGDYVEFASLQDFSPHLHGQICDRSHRVFEDHMYKSNYGIHTLVRPLAVLILIATSGTHFVPAFTPLRDRPSKDAIYITAKQRSQGEPRPVRAKRP